MRRILLDPTPTEPTGAPQVPMTPTVPIATPAPAAPTTPVALVDDGTGFDAFEAIKGTTPEATQPPSSTANTPPPASVTPPVAPALVAPPAVVPPVAPVAPATPAAPVDNTIKLDFTLANGAAQQPNTPRMVNGRDMSGLNAEEETLFRNMNNEAFAKLKPVYLEHGQLKTKAAELEQQVTTLKSSAGRMPDFYQEHPQAFVLDPTFQQAQQAHNNATFEQNYWSKQLEAIEGGQKPKALVLQNGQYFEGQELEATPQIKAWITSNIAKSTQFATQAQQQIQQVANNHGQAYQSMLAGLRKAEDGYFPWAAEGKSHPFKPVMDSVMQALPAQLRSSPLAPFLAKSYATIMNLQEQINNLRKTAGANTTVKQDQLAAGPVISTPATPAIPAVADVTMDDFEAIKRA